MRWLYSFLYTCGMLVALPYLLIVGLIRGKYLSSAWQRFGFIPIQSDRPSCWIHCVSVGEFLAAKPLIRRMQSEFPDLPLFVSTTTITGQKLARILLPDSSFYFPFDWVWCIRRILRRLQPRTVIVLETEIWPNFLWECGKKGVPVILVNGRISDRSFRRYAAFRSSLPRFTRNLMQSEKDVERMKTLGADPEKTTIMGNLKFEFHPPNLSEELGGLIRDWKAGSLLWIAGSTMPGEDQLVLEALCEVRKKHPVKLIIAPRHPERFEEAALLASKSGFLVSRRSLNPQPGSEVLILDTIGELAACYELSDVVFIGGTLRDFGGHNPIEPAYFGKPVVAGPFDSNFRSIFEEFRKHDAILVTTNLSEALTSLLDDGALQESLGQNARRLVRANAGALEIVMKALYPYVTSAFAEPGLPTEALARPGKSVN